VSHALATASKLALNLSSRSRTKKRGPLHQGVAWRSGCAVHCALGFRDVRVDSPAGSEVDEEEEQVTHRPRPQRRFAPFMSGRCGCPQWCDPRVTMADMHT
jgi:hypothetical protein